MPLHQGNRTVNCECKGDISLKSAFPRNKAPVGAALSQELQASSPTKEENTYVGDLGGGGSVRLSVQQSGLGQVGGGEMDSERKPWRDKGVCVWGGGEA